PHAAGRDDRWTCLDPSSRCLLACGPAFQRDMAALVAAAAGAGSAALPHRGGRPPAATAGAYVPPADVRLPWLQRLGVCIVILATANDGSERLPPHGALSTHPEGRACPGACPAGGPGGAARRRLVSSNSDVCHGAVDKMPS